MFWSNNSTIKSPYEDHFDKHTIETDGKMETYRELERCKDKKVYRITNYKNLTKDKTK